jgi:hypothetical protein
MPRRPKHILASRKNGCAKKQKVNSDSFTTLEFVSAVNLHEEDVPEVDEPEMQVTSPEPEVDVIAENLFREEKTHSIITDENVQMLLKQHLRAMSDNERCPEVFLSDLNNTLLRLIPHAPTKISLATTKRWMRYLNFQPVSV